MNEKAAQDTRSSATLSDKDSNRLTAIRIVLINTTHPGNIGAAARAMKVMGLSSLHLVTPKTFPSAEATARASGADYLLRSTVVHDSLESALSGCGLVMGSSARLRSLPMPQVDARAAAELTLTESRLHDVALLFGRERYGLTNAELQRCHQLVHIPVNPEYGSLNLAQAVQVMAYEMRMAFLGNAGSSSPPSDWVPVDGAQMERFYAHLEQTLLDIRFLNPRQPKKLMARLRRLYNRARPDQNEVNILRGILQASQRAAENTDEDQDR